MLQSHISSSTRVTIFGGTGFIGRQIVRLLAKTGAVIAVATRRPAVVEGLRLNGAVGQIAAVMCDYSPASIAKAVAGADIVINCVGQLVEGRRSRFADVQGKLPGLIGAASAAAGVTRLIHISAIGADAQSRSAYARSKAEGEAALKAAFPGATILRPSIVFGPEDKFFNRFARLATIFPSLPLIGGETKFQPVYVADVAAAVMAALANPATAGHTYELGGPAVYSFRQMMQLMLQIIEQPRAIMGVPFGLAASLAGFLPSCIITRDQVKLLRHNNVVSEGAEGFAALGIVPTALEAVLPTYLDLYRPGGRFSALERGSQV